MKTAFAHIKAFIAAMSEAIEFNRHFAGARNQKEIESLTKAWNAKQKQPSFS